MIAARSGRRASPGSLVAAALVTSASACLIADSVARFLRSGTTVDPTAPAATSALVTTGANALTRNPMYVGIAGVLLGHALARRSWASLLPVAGFVAAMDHWQITAEERALAAHFGQVYTRYRAAVPRWLGPRSVRTAIAALAAPRASG